MSYGAEFNAWRVLRTLIRIRNFVDIQRQASGPWTSTSCDGLSTQITSAIQFSKNYSALVGPADSCPTWW
jgi:hypothetical protein